MLGGSQKQAFLITTDVLSKSTVQHYNKLRKAAEKFGDVFILYHSKKGTVPDKYRELPVITFTDDVLRDLKYQPIANSIVPGSNHFPILNFFLKNPHYTSYWCIENDVGFNGEWDYFFNSISANSQSDFISSHIRRYAKSPHWHWWATFCSPQTEIKQEHFFRSFNPIYKLSHRALTYLDTCLKNGCVGHHEVLFATLLINAGFVVEDLSSVKNNVTANLNFCNLQTMRWKPIVLFMGNHKNKLFHPVKPVLTFRQLLIYFKRISLSENKYFTSNVQVE